MHVQMLTSSSDIWFICFPIAIFTNEPLLNLFHMHAIFQGEAAHCVHCMPYTVQLYRVYTESSVSDQFHPLRPLTPTTPRWPPNPLPQRTPRHGSPQLSTSDATKKLRPLNYTEFDIEQVRCYQRELIKKHVHTTYFFAF